MVESLKELNAICQKPNYKIAGNWMVRKILRDAALPCTWLLLHTSITANQVTLIALLIGLFSNLILGMPSSASFLIAMLGLQLWYYLDHVDGQIARYRKESSLTGRFFDYLMHHLIHSTFFLGLGLYGYLISRSILPLLGGILSSFSILFFNLIHDIKAKTFLEWIWTPPGMDLIITPTESAAYQQKSFSWPRLLYSYCHKLCEMHVLMNFMTFFALLQCFGVKGFDFRWLALILYSILAPFLAVTKISYLIRSKKMDHEFFTHFKPRSLNI